MRLLFYFCIPTINGEINGDPFILTSLRREIVYRYDLTIYLCDINGSDTFIKEL